jgi:hypothetical protein
MGGEDGGWPEEKKEGHKEGRKEGRKEGGVGLLGFSKTCTW